MPGFSENHTEVEVGHLLGLRWFNLSVAEHAIQRVSYDPLDITMIEDPGPVYIPGPAEYHCKCGYRSHRAPFPPDHPTGGPVPVLRGARGQWKPGENVATCLVRRNAGTTAWSASTHYAAGGSGGYGGGGGGGGTVILPGGCGGSPGGSGGGGGASMYPPGYAEHEVPHELCGCGFWNYWALGEIQTGSPAVVGIVKGYGRYIWGELGFRCSHAKILAIYLPAWDTNAALAIEDHYQVDVYSNFLAMLEMFKAPAGQPPLTDDYFCKGGLRRGTGAARVAAALKSFAFTCQQCGYARCASGQNLCAYCQVAGPLASLKAAEQASRKQIREMEKSHGAKLPRYEPPPDGRQY